MKWLKKVAATPLTTIAKVVDSLQAQKNDRINAPSIHAVREAINNNGLSFYPIGSIYMSVNNVNPSTIFGGTWVQIKDRFLLASGFEYENGATGGEATHALTANEMPAHTHTVSGTASYSGKYVACSDQGETVGVETGSTNIFEVDAQVSSLTVSGTAASAGGGATHNNMPPYLVVNVWYRTA